MVSKLPIEFEPAKLHYGSIRCASKSYEVEEVEGDPIHALRAA